MINKVLKKMAEEEKKGLFRMLQLSEEHLLVSSSPIRNNLSGPNYE
jgi:hypothetical protein